MVNVPFDNVHLTFLPPFTLGSPQVPEYEKMLREHRRSEEIKNSFFITYFFRVNIVVSYY